MNQIDSELVLVLAPSENDSSVATRILREAGINAVSTDNLDHLCAQMENECAVIVLAEEALPVERLPRVQEQLKKQEAWSDIPVILLTGEGPARSWEMFSASGNISILERPFSRLTLIRAIQVGLRARRKQYLVRNLLEELREATRKRDEFLATLSHELRTPLNVILGWIEILENGELGAEAQNSALKVLDRNARQQKSLIDDLLDTSRIVTGKLHFERSPISIGDVLESVCMSFAPRAKQKNIWLNLTLPGEPCVVMGDEQRLSQVFSNLLTNAIKFTPENGQIDISLAHERDKDQFKVRIKDSGQGIEKDFLPFVFDRLKQEDMSTTRAHGGLGLGLAIAAHIVELHQAKIEVSSEGRGMGTEFTITFPIVNDQLELSRPKEISEVRPDSLIGIRVLVVDDSPDILELINLWLKKAKAEVRMSGSATEALAELTRFKPDILLSDIGMPDMDGYEFIARVRALSDERVRNVPAIALTAYAKDEERAKALDAGFQMHISKPISNSELVSGVALLVAQRQP